MISVLEGKVDIIGEDFISIKTSGGVSYLVFALYPIISKLSIGLNIKLFIETIVKEESITLYGFMNFKDVIWFRSFVKISGIGPKLAILILSSFGLQDIIFAIENGQKDFFTSVSGIGEKVAARIVTEMKKDPTKNSIILNSTLLEHHEAIDDSSGTIIHSEIIQDAVLALEALGFSKSSVYQIVMNLASSNQGITLHEIIRLSLKKIQNS